MSDEPQTLLIVDDDDRLRTHLGRAFEGRGFEVWLASHPSEAIELGQKHVPELAVVDLRMPGGNGLDLIEELLAIDPATKIVVLTGYGSIATALEAVRRGAIHYLTKPADVDAIIQAFLHPATEEPLATVELKTPSLARVEWEHIQRVLTDCGGNITQAAARLGIHRRSLQRKLQKKPTSR